MKQNGRQKQGGDALGKNVSKITQKVHVHAKTRCTEIIIRAEMFILIERTLNALFIFIKKITSPSARFRDIRISKKSPKIAIPKIYRGRQIRGRNVAKNLLASPSDSATTSLL